MAASLCTPPPRRRAQLALVLAASLAALAGCHCGAGESPAGPDRSGADSTQPDPDGISGATDDAADDDAAADVAVGDDSGAGDDTASTADGSGAGDAAATGDAADTGGDTADGSGVPAAVLQRGRDLYAHYCSLCHGDNGQGYVADNANALNNRTFLETATDDFLRAALIHGRPGTPMSAWGAVHAGPLGTDDVDALIAFMRTWQTTPSLDVHNRVITGAAANGAAVYDMHCATCHGDTGQGVSALSLNNPWFHATASDGFIYHAIAEGRPGTTMPAWQGTLTNTEIGDLVAHIRTWQRPVDTEAPDGFEPDYSRAVINPEGAAATFTLRDGKYVAADDVKAALDAGQALIIADARATSDYLEQHITGSISIPFYNIERAIAALPRDRFIVAYCGCPHAASGRLVDALREAGFTQTAVLDEGFYVWRDRGYPLTAGIP